MLTRNSHHLRTALALLFFATMSHAQECVKLGSLTAAPGEAVSGFLEVPAGVDEGTRIPVTIVCGAQPGPTLSLLAGVHGYEYPGITALHAIRKQLDPAGLNGNLIMVHVANPPSFLGRTIYYSPVDKQNLNRMFPGSPDGTLSQRIAFALTTQVIEQSDYLIDLHAGDGNESLRPYVYMPVTGEAKLDAAVKGLALAFGLDHIVIDEGRLRSPDDSLYTDQTALTRGIPAITTETGQLGSNDDRWVAMAEAGVWNVMRHLKMIPGEAKDNPGVVWLRDYQVVASPKTGLFRAAVRDGYAVSEGTVIGTLVDWFGDEIVQIRAPFAGVVNYVLGTPPVSQGEPVAMISKLANP